jgi:hypothetical protein
LFGAVDLLAFYRHSQGSPVEKIKARPSRRTKSRLYFTRNAPFSKGRAADSAKIVRFAQKTTEKPEAFAAFAAAKSSPSAAFLSIYINALKKRRRRRSNRERISRFERRRASLLSFSLD